MTDPEPVVRRKPWLAGLLSCVTPGLGQLYNGQVTKALLVWLFMNMIMVHIFMGLMVYAPLHQPYNLLLPILLALSVYVPIVRDAVLVARQQGESYELKPFNRWYVYLGVLALVMLTNGFITTDLTRSYAQAFKIPLGAMLPTILIGDHILIDKSIYEMGKTPQRGDIIVFKYPEDESKDFIKRVIGLPGDIVEIRDKQVVLNGVSLNDRSYTQRVDPGVIDGAINPRDNFGPITVPQGMYFVLGDNRDQSLDSRFWGYVQLSKIKGKALFIYWSWDNKEVNVRWDRIGKLIQ